MLSDQTIRQVIGLLLDADENDLPSERALADIEGWDSVNALRVLVYLEGEKGLSIGYEAFMSATTVGELMVAVGGSASQPAHSGASPASVS